MTVNWSVDCSVNSECLKKLRQLMTQASQAKSESLSRLAFHERDLKPEMTKQHLAAILVPFERLQGRALRDDEFCVEEGDRLTGAERKPPGSLVVVAENLRSAFNVGAVLRTSEALGVDKVILTGYTSTPVQEKTAQTSMGTADLIEWQSGIKSKEAIAQLKTQGYKIVALETGKYATEIQNYSWPSKCALIIGNERFGVDNETLELADFLVRIPLYGKKNSLNVGIAFGIAAQSWCLNQEKLPQDSSSHFSPIGVFRGPAKFRYEARRQAAVADPDDVGMIELQSRKGFEQALDSLTGFSRIWILYQFHQNKNWKPMVMPPRGPRVKRGVFATRSPHRPNPLGLSCVELISVNGLKIYVRGTDLLDGSPILDIKPYLPYADSFPEANSGWTEKLESKKHQLIFSELVQSQLQWLHEHEIFQLEGFIRSQLEFDPTDSDRKRVYQLSESDFTLAYRTWRIAFSYSQSVDSTEATLDAISIKNIYSAYSHHELQNQDDIYGDKIIHRAFCAHFRDNN